MANTFRFSAASAIPKSGDAIGFRVESLTDPKRALAGPATVTFYASEDPAEAGVQIARYEVTLKAAGSGYAFDAVSRPAIAKFTPTAATVPTWEEDLLKDGYGMGDHPGWVRPKATWQVPHVNLELVGSGRPADLLRIVQHVPTGLMPKSKRKGGDHAADPGGYLLYLGFEMRLADGTRVGGKKPNVVVHQAVNYLDVLAHNAREVVRVEMEGHNARIDTCPASMQTDHARQKDVHGIAYGSLFGDLVKAIEKEPDTDRVDYANDANTPQGDRSPWYCPWGSPWDRRKIGYLPSVASLRGHQERSCIGWLIQGLSISHIKTGVPKLFEQARAAYVAGGGSIDQRSGMGLIRGLQESNGWTLVYVERPGIKNGLDLARLRREGVFPGSSLRISAIVANADPAYAAKIAFIDGLEFALVMQLNGLHTGLAFAGQVWEVHYSKGYWDKHVFDNSRSISRWIGDASHTRRGRDSESFGFVALPPGVRLP